MKKTAKLLLIVLGGAVLFVALAIGGFALVMFNGMDATQRLSIGAVDASGLADGAYVGGYDAGRFANRVSITVSNGKITGIDVMKTVQFEQPELTKALVDRVITSQNTDVDVQSGATLTSKAYLASIEDALGKK